MPRVIGHEAVLNELRAIASREEPAHALLLAGVEGVGRAVLAREYALLLNCERLHPAPSLLDPAPASPAAAPCGECRPCRLITEGHHPDVMTVGPGDMLCRPRPGEPSHPAHPLSRDIRLCQVRGMADVAARFPIEARFRVIIIDPAERLYRDSQHALLKTLEEPPGHTAFVLVTAAPESLVETVRSRCHRINVGLLARPVIEAGLVDRSIAPDVAARAAAAARGRPGRAIAFAADPDLIAARQRLLERCARIAADRVAERLKYAGDLADRYRRDRAQVLTELDAWEAYWEDQLRAAASAGDTASGPLDALRAVLRVREDLLANVQAHPAFDLMLLTFPRRTLDERPRETAFANA